MQEQWHAVHRLSTDLLQHMLRRKMYLAAAAHSVTSRTFFAILMTPMVCSAVAMALALFLTSAFCLASSSILA